MRLGVRGKLFFISLSLMLVVIAASGLYLRQALRAQLEERIRTELQRYAQVCRELVQRVPAGQLERQADKLADRLGQATATRVTIIDAAGTVLGDSELAPQKVKALPNHGGRPEILAALERGQGLSRRYSTTLRTDMLYLALPLTIGEERGAVRVAKALDEVDRGVGQLTILVSVAALLALLLAVVMSGLASHVLSRVLGRLVERVRTMANRTGTVEQEYEVDELAGLIGSVSKMSRELEQLVTKLGAERDRFEAVLEGMGEGVIALDQEQRITHVNHTALALLGQSSLVVGKTLLEAVRTPALRQLAMEALAGRPATTEIEISKERPVTLLARATPQRVTGGAVLVFHDLTEIKRLQTVRQDFVANVSHELRTPVSVVLANAETLMGGALEDPERAREFLSALVRNAQRLSEVISDLLDLSRIDSDKVQLKPGPVALVGLVRDCQAALAETREKKGQELSLAIDPDLLVHADQAGLRQVLFNLVDNAIKYTPQGGTITVSARSEADNTIRCEVRDDGPGIPEPHRQRVFERFYRVDTGRSRALGGTGLGLAIVKNLVEAMGGQVGLEAAAPHGCCFWFTLPHNSQ